MVSSTDRKAPHYVFFFTFLLPYASWNQYSPQYPLLKNPQLTFLPQFDQVSHPYKKQAKLYFCIS